MIYAKSLPTTSISDYRASNDMVQLIAIALLIVAVVMYINEKRKLVRLRADYDKLDKNYYDKQMECAGLTCDIEAADRDNSNLRMKLSELDVDDSEKEKATFDKVLGINEIQDMKFKLESELCKAIENPIRDFQDATGVEVDRVYVNLDKFQEITSKRQRFFGVVTHVDVDTKI